MVEEILPDLFRIKIPMTGNPLKYINSYVVRSADRNLIIDTGLNNEECHKAMLAGLDELNVDLARTDFFITHFHADHFGLVLKLITDTSTVFFNRPDSEFLEGFSTWEPMFEYARRYGFPKDQVRAAIESHPGFKHGSTWMPETNILEDDEIISAGEYSFRCVATPGHSRGHTCLYEPLKKILISGDHILGDITPNIQCWTDDSNPLQDYLDSLDKVYKLDIDLVLPGHRKLIRNFRKRIQELKQHHYRRAEEILVILQKGSKNAFETAGEMKWDIDAKSWDDFPLAQKWFATGETIAHLRYIEAQQKIFRVTKG
ncbi:MAG: MBL fold metallo-hydrolase, partial [Thermodesulfobacteriota bacterium]|nr:MBL fold metallo-hydrolase [Thermodesulfobacteriota bacterium]